MMPAERRRYFRVPMEGEIRWRSDRKRGLGRIVDVSPCGAAFDVPVADAFKIGALATLTMELGGGLDWRVADDAQVVRRASNGGSCRLAVQFPAGDHEHG